MRVLEEVRQDAPPVARDRFGVEVLRSPEVRARLAELAAGDEVEEQIDRPPTMSL